MLVKPIISFIVGHTRSRNCILTHNGGEICESLYNCGVWWIEQCGPKLMAKCFASQNNIKHYYKVKITSMKATIGIHVLCYDGWLDQASRVVFMSLKIFGNNCCENLNYCVEGLGRKHVVDRPLVLVVWLVQEGTNLTQDEVTTMEEVDFVLNCKQLKCPPHNLFGDENFIHLHQPLDVDSWSKPCNN
jgi:hypothetical protein